MTPDALSAAETELEACRRAAHRLELLAEQITAEQHVCRRLRERLADERDDVAALERLSVTALLTRARGRLDDRRRAERADVAEVEVELATRQAALARLTAEFEAARELATGADAASERVEAALAARAARIAHGDPAVAAQLAELDGRLAAERAARIEIVEAHQAAIGADGALQAAIEAMSSARTWSNLDTWAGGEWLTSTVKHQQLDGSVEVLASAHASLLRLRAELGDLAAAIHHPNLSGPSTTLATLDVWFDNLFSDLLVHHTIIRSLTELEHSRDGVRELLGQLAREERIATGRVAELDARRDQLLRSA